MRILAPCNSYNSAKIQISAGADEIYCGYQNMFFKNLSFSGRGEVDKWGKMINPTIEEFEKIIKYTHNNGKEVHFVANTSFMVDIDSNKMRDAYKKYILDAVDLGIDRIIIGDLGNLSLISKLNIKNIPIVSSVFFGAFNEETLKFLKSKNVKRVVLPHHLTFDEIKTIKEKSDLEIEIFAGVGCSNIDGTCSLLHNCGENIDVGIPCKALFCNQAGIEHTFLDATLDCLLCSIYKLLEIGIDVLKVIGRDQDIKFTSLITKLHNEMIKCAKNSKSEEEYLILLNNYLSNIGWWNNEFCNKNRCKFKENIINRSFI